jgi:PHD/YefM family antitoxin component YafN of YafNO toxin-antitoxin module
MKAGRFVASISSRQFNHDVGAAKRAAQIEPVVITDRGEPAFVLLTFEEFRRLRADVGQWRSLADVIRMEADDDIEIEFDPQPLRDLPRPLELGDE